MRNVGQMKTLAGCSGNTFQGTDLSVHSQAKLSASP